MLMNKYNVVKLALFIALFVFSVGYSLAWTDPGPGTVPSDNNTPAPINISTAPQIKEGPLTLFKTLWLTGSNNGINSRLFVDGKIGIGPGFATADPPKIDTTALLDVDGQIRVRGGNEGPGIITSKVLTATTTGGLAVWRTPPTGVTQLNRGLGITFNPDPMTQTNTITSGTGGFITAYLPETQRRIDSGCGPNQGVKSISAGTVSQLATSICTAFVTRVTGSGGATTTGPGSGTGGGTVNVAVNLATNSGLKVNASNQLLLDVSPIGGLGLSGNQLTLRTDCGTNPFLTWNNGASRWDCMANPTPPSSPPGGSVMYIRGYGWGFNYSVSEPLSCPVSGDGGSVTSWIEAPRGTGLNYTSEEDVGGTVTQVNKVRICYKLDQTCQIFYSTSKDLIANGNPPNCPTGFYDAIKNPGGAKYYAPGGLRTEYQRVCFKCY